MRNRIGPGPHIQTARNGYVLNLDQELSRERIDVLAGLMEAKGLEPNDVCEAWFDGEGVVFRCPERGRYDG